MKKFFLMAVMGLFAAVTQLNAQEAIKIGYTDIDYILSALPEAKQIESELNDYGNQLQTQLQTKMTDFDAKMKDYQKNSQTWLPEIRADKEQELQQLQQSIQKFQQDAENSLQKKQVQLLQPVYKKIQDAIDEVRKENGYTFIFSVGLGNVSILLSADEQYDVSDLVFAKLGVQPPADTADSDQ